MNDQRYWRDPQLPFVESRLAFGSRACYVPHTHDTLSLGAVDSGHSNYVCGDDRARLGPGSLVLIPATRVHACNPDTDSEWSYQMLHLDVEWASAVLRENGGTDAHEVLARPSINQDRGAYRRYCALNGLLFSNADSAEKEAALILFVSERSWLGAPRDVPPVPRIAADRLRRITDLLHDAYGERLPIEQLAQMAGMSRYAFIRAFRAATGMAPHAYQLDLRINAARRLLRDGRALTAVAHDLGFADQAHFQRAFKERVAMTPGAYRRATAS
ncbi:AraC family transcriptional regulator [Paraburkholderia azotifigens]|uniref:AraC family transcriptional regulator n=1 Tax=Paraburkholderia azotifigens TaxID=2057004 RepID=UPI003179086B